MIVELNGDFVIFDDLGEVIDGFDDVMVINWVNGKLVLVINVEWMFNEDLFLVVDMVY